VTRYEWLKRQIKKQKREPTQACIEWPYGTNGDEGYGQVRVGARRYQVHRLAYQLFYGHAPRRWALHSCNNRKCFNPLHLRDGDAKDNYNDMVRAGNRRTHVILTECQVREIVRLLATTTLTYREIGDRFGVTDSCIAAIKYERAWKRIPRPRAARANRNGRLTEPEVIEIIRLLSDGMSQTAIAKKFGMSQQTISEIKNGRTWPHLPRPEER
jgi:transposase